MAGPIWDGDDLPISRIVHDALRARAEAAERAEQEIRAAFLTAEQASAASVSDDVRDMQANMQALVIRAEAAEKERDEVHDRCAEYAENWDAHSAAAIDAERERDELRAEVARLRAALQVIVHGKIPEDNEHPLGDLLAMTGRFFRVAAEALFPRTPTPRVDQQKGREK